jgi:hypothetical protein
MNTRSIANGKRTTVACEHKCIAWGQMSDLTLLLPLIDGSSARSAATADVMMLLGPPTKQPMKARRRSRIVTGMSFMYSANTQRRGQRMPKGMSE